MLPIRLAGFLPCAFVALLVSSVAHAADFTDLVDAADDKDDLIESTYDPFDFVIQPTLRLDFGEAVITREAACVPDASDLVGEASENFADDSPRLDIDSARCAEPQIVDNRELDYRYQRTTVDLELKAGIYKDLEFHLVVPFVVSETTGLRYGEGVDPERSSVDPSESRIEENANDVFGQAGDRQTAIEQLDVYSAYRFFNVGDEFTEVQRSGFGDPKIGVHWAPYNDDRDPTKATLLFGMDYVLPIAPLQRPDNDAVGEGMNELQWKLAASKQFDWIEPYFGLEYFLPLPAPRSPIGQVDNSNDGQVFIAPPQRGQITVGTEFIPFEDVEEGIRYAIDLQFQFGYVSEGRDYTPLYNYFGDPEINECQGKSLDEILPEYDDQGNLTSIGDVQCAYIARQPSNAPERGGQPDPIYDLSSVDPSEYDDITFDYDGIMTVESYGTFRGKLGFDLQPSRYFAFKADVALTHKQEHFLTNARTGRDAADSLEETPDDTVDLEGPDTRIERNPVYNPVLDSSGNRFRIQEYNIWSVWIGAALMF